MLSSNFLLVFFGFVLIKAPKHLSSY